MAFIALTRVTKVGVGGGVVLSVVLFSESVLVPVSDETLRIIRVLVHGCQMTCFIK